MEKTMNNPLLSIIIRTKNEERYLEKILQILQRQTIRDFEIIIVDDNSADKTQSIAKKYGCKIITIPKGKFSHPYSCNLGAENAKGKYLVYLNGHSIPCSIQFLEAVKNFEDETVAGVFSVQIAHKEGTFADLLLHNLSGYTLGLFKFRARWKMPGLLATVNAMIRKDLWEKTKFDEQYNGGKGGEDSLWAWQHMKKGYNIIHDPKLKVRHSHHLKLNDIKWQLNNWKKMSLGKMPEVQKKYF